MPRLPGKFRDNPATPGICWRYGKGRSWQSDWLFLRYTDPHTGKRVFAETDPKTDQVKIAQELLRKALHGPRVTSTTVQEILDEYEAELRRRGTTGGDGLYGYLERLRVRFGALRVSAFDVRAFKAFLDEVQATRSDSTVGRYVINMKAAFNHARRYGLLDDHPMCRYRNNYRSRARLVFWSDEEVAQLLEKLIPWARFVVRLSIATGLRESDVLALRWDGIKDGVLTIVQAKTRRRRDGGVLLAALSAEALAILDEMRRVREGKSPYLFPTSPTKKNPDGHHKTRRNFYRFFGAAREGTSFEAKTFHDLRRTFAQRLLRAGVDSQIILGLMGQKSFTALSHYLDPSELDLQRKALAAVQK